MIKPKIKAILIELPSKPGVYRFYDKTDNLLYVGKAKNLKKRVSSYFSKQHHSGKTNILVSKIENIKPIIVETESDALLLENNLIKEHQPKYNILLKDDKTFPWICIKNEPFPRVFTTRTYIKDGSKYFGPYTSGKTVRTILDLINALFKLRTCKYNLSEENISRKKFKVCLEYHIGNCKAPCIGNQKEKDYNINIDQIEHILKGNLKTIKEYLSNLMHEHAENYKFEEAAEIKNKLDLIDNYRSKSTIVHPTINNIDVFTIINDVNTAYINYFKIIDGAIIQSYTGEYKKQLDENKEELLSSAIIDIRNKYHSNSKEIILPFNPDFEIPGAKIHIPQIGDKKKLLDLSERNLKYYRFEKLKQLEKVNPEKHTERILNTIQKDLRLNKLPVHIECFDNSNIQGTNPVAACVVFKNTKPAKKEYRKFNIKTVEGANDFASMEEVIYRRYKRLVEENKELPQLIVIDGGKGQLSSAVKSIKKLNLFNKIAIIGIAKKLEEIYFPGDSIPLYLDKNSESLKVIQHLRNEAHRFGITFHREKRSKEFIQSELNTIKGIGTKTAEALLAHFNSIDNIKTANIDSIASIIGKSKATIVYTHFRNNSNV